MTDRRAYIAPHDARPLNVLLAEDEESFVDALVIGLGHEGFKVSVARDGLEALRLFEETAPDLVLLDLMLPKMSGHRRLPGHPSALGGADHHGDREGRGDRHGRRPRGRRG